jgi:flagellar protein FlaG
MNIQALSSPTVSKSDDRPAAGIDSPAVSSTTAAKTASTPTDPAAKAKPSRDEVNAAVKKLNESMPASSQTLEFSVDHDSKEIVVKLIDQDTKEVVRQIPSVEALQMAKAIDKMQGLLIHHTA